MAANRNQPKHWTGEAVGRAVIEHLIDEYRTVFDPEYQPVMEVEQLEQLKNTLITDADRRVYNQYITLYNGVLDLVSQSNAMTQQFCHGYYRMMNVVQSALLSCSISEELKKLPVPSCDESESGEEHPVCSIHRMLRSLTDPIGEDTVAFRDTLMIPAMRSLYACHTMLTLIGSIYKFDHISVIGPQMADHETKIALLNEAILSLFGRVEQQEELPTRMRTYIKPIEVQCLQPSEQEIRAAEKQLSDLPSLNKAVFAELAHRLQATDGGVC